MKLLLLFSLFLFSHGFCQSDLQRMQLLPGVKSVHEQYYVLDKKDDLVHIVQNDVFVRFNENGMKTYEEHFYPDSSVRSAAYTYNRDGLVSRKRERTTGGYSNCAYSYRYDSNGRISEIVTRYSLLRRSRTHYGYDEAGNRNDIEIGLSKRQAYAHFVHTFDSSRNIIKTLTYNYNDSLFSTHVYTYDNRGNVITDHWTYPDGSLDVLTVQTYTKEFSLPLHRHVTDRYGTFLEQEDPLKKSREADESYIFGLDVQNNWIEKMIIGDKKTTIVIQRNICY